MRWLATRWRWWPRWTGGSSSRRWIRRRGWWPRSFGQDLDEVDGVFRIARRVAKDRVISTVDPDARHGHKTSARGFDGYKGHLAADPDSEIITATDVTAANAGDADPAEDLIADDLPEPVSRGGDDRRRRRPERRCRLGGEQTG